MILEGPGCWLFLLSFVFPCGLWAFTLHTFLGALPALPHCDEAGDVAIVAQDLWPDSPSSLWCSVYAVLVVAV